MIDLEKLKRLAGEASGQYPLDLQEEYSDGTGTTYVYHCPLCDGNGVMEADEAIDHFSKGAAGIQVYGIGDDLTKLEDFVREFNPEVAKQLIEALECAVGALETIAKRDGDWDYGPLAHEKLSRISALIGKGEGEK